MWDRVKLAAGLLSTALGVALVGGAAAGTNCSMNICLQYFDFGYCLDFFYACQGLDLP